MVIDKLGEGWKVVEEGEKREAVIPPFRREEGRQ